MCVASAAILQACITTASSMQLRHKLLSVIKCTCIMPVCLSVCLSCLSVCLSACLSVCLSVCQPECMHGFHQDSTSDMAVAEAVKIGSTKDRSGCIYARTQVHTLIMTPALLTMQESVYIRQSAKQLNKNGTASRPHLRETPQNNGLRLSRYI